MLPKGKKGTPTTTFADSVKKHADPRAATASTGGGEVLEHYTLTFEQVAEQFAEKNLAKLLRICNDPDVRRAASEHWGVWRGTNLTDRPFLWAIFAAANNDRAKSFFSSPAKIHGKNAPCLFYNYGICEKQHKIEYHCCMLCQETHPLCDYNMSFPQEGECPLWKRLCAEFKALCDKLHISTEVALKLFRLEESSPANPTVQITRRVKPKRAEDHAVPVAAAPPPPATKSVKPAKSADVHAPPTIDAVSRESSSRGDLSSKEGSSYDLWTTNSDVLAPATPIKTAASQQSAAATAIAPPAPREEQPKATAVPPPVPAAPPAAMPPPPPAVTAEIPQEIDFFKNLQFNHVSGAAPPSPMLTFAVPSQPLSNAAVVVPDPFTAGPSVSGGGTGSWTAATALRQSDATAIQELADSLAHLLDHTVSDAASPSTGVAGDAALLQDGGETWITTDATDADDTALDGDMSPPPSGAEPPVHILHHASFPHAPAHVPSHRAGSAVGAPMNAPIAAPPARHAQHSHFHDPHFSSPFGLDAVDPNFHSFQQPLFGGAGGGGGQPLVRVGGDDRKYQTVSTWLMKVSTGGHTSANDDHSNSSTLLSMLHEQGNAGFIAVCSARMLAAARQRPALIDRFAPMLLRDYPIVATVVLDDPSPAVFRTLMVAIGRILDQRSLPLQLSTLVWHCMSRQAKRIGDPQSNDPSVDIRLYNAAKAHADDKGKMNNVMVAIDEKLKEVVSTPFRDNHARNVALHELALEVEQFVGKNSCALDVLLLRIENDMQERVMEAFSMKAVALPADGVVSQSLQATITEKRFARLTPNKLFNETYRGNYYKLSVNIQDSIPFCDWNPALFNGQFVEIAFQNNYKVRCTVRSVMPYELILKLGDDEPALPTAVMTVHFKYNPWHLTAMINALKSPVTQEYLHGLRACELRASQVKQQFDIGNEELDVEEQNAINRILNRPRLFTIWGPPGTGKTHTLVGAMREIVRHGLGRVLACASSNFAANLLAQKLQEKGEMRVLRVFSRSVSPYDIKQSQFDTLLQISNLQCRPEEITIETVFSNATREDILACDVVVCTTAHTDWMRHLAGSSDFFQFVLIDEAGQALEAEILIPFSFCNKDTPLILAGDPHQLGPMILSPVALRHGAANSFLSKNVFHAALGNIDYVLLRRCYRCHPDILNLFNSLVYNGELQSSVPNSMKRNMCLRYERLPRKQTPVVFVNVPPPTAALPPSRSHMQSALRHYNESEVSVVVDACRDLTRREKFLPSDIVVLTPYREQQLKIRARLVMEGMSDIDAMIVDQFQGQERLIVIISAVTGRRDPRVTNSEFVLGFVGDKNRTNVALSRARGLLIIVGDARQLSEADPEVWGRVISDLGSLGVIVESGHFRPSV